ncbi:MAG: hypothetical protein QOF91_3782 [Alphaproteobacteria bacterium]|jgi:hypothetical protein|nr:hypothetical protein [Alphaproteobacteria bacterium]
MRIALAILLAVFAVATGPAHADPYRWCAQYGGRGATNCYFVNLAQCRAAISGNGGFCTPNNFYDGRPVLTPDDRLGRPGRRAAR